MAACAMDWAMSTEITFCTSKSCESAVIENAATSASVATAKTGTRRRGIEVPPDTSDVARAESYKHGKRKVNRDPSFARGLPKGTAEQCFRPQGARVTMWFCACGGTREVIHS